MCIRDRCIFVEKETEDQPELDLGLPKSGGMLLPLSYRSSSIEAKADMILTQLDLKSRPFGLKGYETEVLYAVSSRTESNR